MSDYEFEEDEPYVVIEKRSGGVSTFLLGLALGAGIALLFAPQTGVVTRRDLRKKVRQVRDAAEGVVDEVAAKVEEKYDSAKAEVGDRLDTARGAVATKTRQVVEAIDAGRVAAREARADLERRIAATKASYQAARSGSSTET